MRFRPRERLPGHDMFVRILVALPLITIALSMNVSAGQALSLPTDVYDALVRNAEQMNSINLAYTQQYRPLIDRSKVEEVIGWKPDVQEVYLSLWHETLSLSDHRYHLLEKYDLPAGSKFVRENESAFDGTWWYVGNRHNFNSDTNRDEPTLTRSSVARIAYEEPQQDLGYFEYAEATGFSTAADWSKRLARERVQSTILKLLDRGGVIRSVSDEARNGLRLLKVELDAPNPFVIRAKECDLDELRERLKWMSPERIERVVAETERRRTLPDKLKWIWYLDRDKSCALVRYEQRLPNGSLLMSVDNEQLAQVADRPFWLPKSIARLRYTDYGQKHVFDEPILALDVRLESVDVRPRDPASFSLEYAAPHSRTRTIPDDGPMTEVVVPATEPSEPPAQAANDSAKVGAADRGGGMVFRAAIVAMAAVVVVALVTKLLRRRCAVSVAALAPLDVREREQTADD